MGYFDYQEKYFNFDKIKVYSLWQQAEYPKANVVIVHGVGETMHRYDQLSVFMLQHGYNVVRYDQPGHGKTGGERGFIESPHILSDVCQVIVDQVKQTYYQFPTFLIGHSMGGFTVLDFLTRFSGEIDGAIVTDPYSVYEYPLLGKRPIDGDSHEIMRATSLSKGVNADERVARRSSNDPSNVREIKIGLMNSLYEGSMFLRKNINRITEPILILHGEQDGLIDYRDSFSIYEKIGSSDKELHIFPFIMHALLGDPSRRNEIYAEIDRWLDRHVY